MSTVIQVAVKSVYGQRQIYPVNAQAKALADIAGTKTLSPATIKKAIEAFGFEVVEVPAYSLADLGC